MSARSIGIHMLLLLLHIPFPTSLAGVGRKVGGDAIIRAASWSSSGGRRDMEWVTMVGLERAYLESDDGSDDDAEEEEEDL